MKRNLPVKLFEKRKQIDERLVEGGGKNILPKWTLSEDELKKRAYEFIETLGNTVNSFNNRKENRKFIPLVIKAEINIDALAKTHRKEIVKLFKTPNDESQLIGFNDEKELLIKINNLKALHSIEKELYKYDKNAYSISALNYIEGFNPKIALPEKPNSSLKIKLINYDDYEMNKAVRNAFEDIFTTNTNLKYKKTEYAENLIIYKVDTHNLNELEDIKNFEGLYSLEPMPSYSISLDLLDDEVSIDIIEPEDTEEYPVIGILDSGIERIPQLKPWIMSKKHESYPEEYLDKSHGTFVAGIALYGDKLQGANYTGLKGCKLFDAAVYPNTARETIDQDDLVNNVREAIKNNCNEIKIWNMSLGTIEESDLDSFSDFGMALDSIQDTYNVLICKSAGNCKNFLTGAPKSRISKSADSVRSIVVGSLTHEKGLHDLEEANCPSPFTRIGPGPSYIVKPDLVHYGGNAGVHKGKLIQNGVKSFNKSGSIVKQCGTSFSTPRVSSILAGLDHNLNEDFNQLLLKGLLIHSATFPKEMDMKIHDKINQAGFGIPKSINDILHNTPNEITMILQDTLDKGDYIEILDYPFPDDMVEDGYYYGEVIITVVYNPILDPSQGSEYCQSDIEVSFGTYDQKKLRDTTKPTIRNPIGKAGGMNILNTSCYSQKNSKENLTVFGQTEKLLIQYGNKFYPVKKYAINLQDMTPTNKEKCLKHPKQWFLSIEGLYRNFVENKALKGSIELNQDFCVLITLRDPKNKHMVYDKTTELLNRHNFIHSNIKLRNEVQIAVDRIDV